MDRIRKSRKFKTDYKKLNPKQKETLKEVIQIIFNKEPLSEEYKDHQLIGNLKQYRDCHIENDLLLLYKTTETELILYRIDKHSNLFK